MNPIPAPGEIGDLLLSIIYIPIILFVAAWIQRNYIRQNPIYRYFTIGLFAKIFGAIGLGLIYSFYYGGGDTTAYHRGCAAMVNLIFKDFDDYLVIMFDEFNRANFSVFDMSTGYPNLTMYKDPKTFFVIRLLHPVAALSFKYYFPMAILVACLSFTGIWQLFKMFCEYYPKLTRHFAVAILFMPSVIFWGSGILKDSITLAAACWFTYSIYSIFIVKRRRAYSVLTLLISAWLLISIKPYIFVALMPGALLWAGFDAIASVKNNLIRVLIVPVVLSITIGAIGFVFGQVGGEFDKWGSPDALMQLAATNQEDLRRGQYGDHFFNLGEFDPTFSGVIVKAPQAIAATLFRPFIWEAGNIVMLLSAFENLFIMLLTFYVLIKTKVFGAFRLIRKIPLLSFALTFSIFFAFAVGLSTANFGALVRFKIPMIPFFLSSLFILVYHIEEAKKGRKIY